MNIKMFGREFDLDLSKKGEPWDLAVLIQHVEPDEKGDPSVKNTVVPYFVHVGLIRPAGKGRLTLHLIFFRLMVTFYGKA